ncbi:MAG: zinc-ribbon domain containing protein [Dehalococcoidia bacterium]|nr:zinc-ribbon domain containing protein [Dehalococcoidia bacterium]MDW8120111.1 zinc-ribbon domain containing protein [Chloroflexota bacterium]
MPFADKTLTCRDCGNQFVFTAGEQQFYQAHGLLHEPARCPPCRAARRQSRATSGNSVEGNPVPRRTFPAICAQCGQETQVPFQPRQGRPVYCSSCFANLRGTR